MNTYQAELYHHGIKGQKWGVRRYQNPDGSLTAAGEKRYSTGELRDKMKSAKKESKQAYKDFRKKVGLGIGIDKIQGSAEAKKHAEEVALKYIDAKAAYKGRRSEKAEMNAYRKIMQPYGIRGSVGDARSDQSATKIYNHLATTRGKEYADRVERSVQNHAYVTMATSAAVGIGMAFVTGYLEYKQD